MRLAGRRVLVIGGASGIGRAIVLRAVREGATVAVADVDSDAAEATASQARDEGGKAASIAMDVADEASVKEGIDAAVRELGGLDVLINTAGVLSMGLVEEFPAGDWDRVLAVNARGQFLAVKHAVPALKESDAASIITLGSAAGIKGGPGATAYSASKGAVIAFSRALAVELSPQGIRVNALCPGWVDTAFNQPAYDMMGGDSKVTEFVEGSVPLKRMATPDEIAAYAVFLASDDSSYVTAQAVVADGGML
jgi:NAD(P)-dependent dehydrogenase (short-subunit alcohol dehydrogenase family)